MNHHPKGHGRHRIGRWLPHQDALEDWLEGLARHVRDKAGKATLRPVIAEFAKLIDDDPVVHMYVTQMIEQVPHAKRYSKRHLESVDQMLRLMNEVIGRAPEYNETGLVGTPLNAVLDWCMGTPAGFAAFRYPPINAMLRKILNVWCEYLNSPASLYVINDTPRGWKCASAKKSDKDRRVPVQAARETLGFHVVERLLYATVQAGYPADRRPRRRQGDRQRLRVDTVRPQDQCEAAGTVLGEGPAVFAAGHAW